MNKKIIASVTGVILVGTSAFVGIHSSVSPAPQFSLHFNYPYPDILPWVNLFVERSSNLIDWDRVYTYPLWVNSTNYNFSYTEDKTNIAGYYRVGVYWTNEQFRPTGY